MPPPAISAPAQTHEHLTRHKISCREPSAHGTQQTLTTADTRSVNGRLARGQLHRLVRRLRNAGWTQQQPVVFCSALRRECRFSRRETAASRVWVEIAVAPRVKARQDDVLPGYEQKQIDRVRQANGLNSRVSVGKPEGSANLVLICVRAEDINALPRSGSKVAEPNRRAEPP